jgi:hypothetical protein
VESYNLQARRRLSNPLLACYAYYWLKGAKYRKFKTKRYITDTFWLQPLHFWIVMVKPISSKYIFCRNIVTQLALQTPNVRCYVMGDLAMGYFQKSRSASVVDAEGLGFLSKTTQTWAYHEYNIHARKRN